MTDNSGNSVIDTLVASSPVEVQIVEESEGELDAKNCLGIYYHGHGVIKILKDLRPYETLAVLAHEIGHVNCCNKRCECFMSRDNDMKERHAWTYALRWLLRHGQEEALEFGMFCISSYLSGNYIDIDLWTECTSYLKNGE